jgi:hypothetical protein
VALGVEPTPATCGMQPLLTVQAFGVFAHKQIIAPLRVAERVGIEWAGNMGLATVAEFALFAGAAPGTGNFEHGIEEGRMEKEKKGFTTALRLAGAWVCALLRYWRSLGHTAAQNTAAAPVQYANKSMKSNVPPTITRKALFCKCSTSRM